MKKTNKFRFRFKTVPYIQETPARPANKMKKGPHKRLCHCRECYNPSSRDYGGVLPEGYRMRAEQLRKDAAEEAALLTQLEHANR